MATNASQDPDFVSLEAHINESGALFVASVGKEIPFPIKRFYLMRAIPTATRGAHAHKKTEQVAFCIQGSVEVFSDDGTNKKIVRLSAPYEGMLFKSKTWHVLRNFSPDCLVLIVASEPYDEADYMRDYDEFLRFIKA